MSQLPHEGHLRQAPPHDPEAERGFVGSLLRWPKYLDELKRPVYVECLHHPRLRLIYQTMLDLREDADSIDVVTVGARMREKGQLASIGGESELDALVVDYPTGAMAQHYADIVVANWKRRTLAAAATDAVREAYGFVEPETIQANLERRLDVMADIRAESVVFDIAEVHAEVMDRVRKMRDEGRNIVGVTTGFEDLDVLTSGFVPGELVIIGARPGVGKTSFALNMLVKACQHAPVLFNSVEMRRGAIVERLLSSITNVNSIKVRHGRLSDEEIDRMHEAKARIRGGKFWLADIPHANMAEIVQVSRQVKRKVPELAVIVVDYLQLVRHEQRHLKRNEQVADISGRLKALAGTLNVCVVALSQLSREVESRAVKRPQLSDLKESGAIEQDADVVVFLHRPAAENPKERPDEADAIVAKNRNGEIGQFLLKFDKSTTTFTGAPPKENQEEWPGWS